MIPTLALGGLGLTAGTATGGGGGATTLNPADIAADLTLSGGNLTLTRDGTNNNAWRCNRATTSKSTGKWYFEVQWVVYGGNGGAIAGWTTAGASLTTYPGANTNTGGWNYDSSPTFFYYSGSSVGGGAQGNPGDYEYFCIDFDAGKFWVKSTNVAGWVGGGDPALGTSPSGTFTPNTVLFPVCGHYYATSQGVINFGATAFNGTIPSGFTAWG